MLAVLYPEPMDADCAGCPPALNGVGGAVVSAACWLLRLVDFRGKARLFSLLPLPHMGFCTIQVPHGPRLRLDMSQEMERSYFFGLYDRMRLKLVHTMLANGGDFVDVGANIGMFATTAALELGGKAGQVLAFEPNPTARTRLEENLALNGCSNATVVPFAATRLAFAVRSSDALG